MTAFETAVPAENKCMYLSSTEADFLEVDTATRDITERDNKQKFRPNQNVLRDVMSRLSIRITAHSSLDNYLMTGNYSFYYSFEHSSRNRCSL